MVDNGDWIRPVSYLDWLRDVGKHFTVNYMLAKESVRARLEDRDQGISYTEFSYMLLQAYDFLHLFEKYNCRIQAGGKDQWGNITAGLELIRRCHGRPGGPGTKAPPEAWGITLPLVTTAAGEKFGKSAGNALWLDPDRTRPYDLFQYWINTDDRDVEKFLKYFTFLEVGEINDLLAEQSRKPERRLAQRRLADEVVELIHGKESASAARTAAAAFFQGHAATSGREGLEEFAISWQEAGALEIDALLVKCKAVRGRSEARRLISGGGAYIDGRRVQQPEERLPIPTSPQACTYALRIGKKRGLIVRVSSA